MARKRRPGPRRRKAESRIAQLRRERGLTQAEMADAIGIPRRTYQRLENQQINHPPVSYLINAATLLGVTLYDVLEDEPRSGWVTLHKERPGPPDLQSFWRRKPDGA